MSKNETTRQKALDLLKRAPRKEGYWDRDIILKYLNFQDVKVDGNTGGLPVTFPNG